MGKRSIPSVFGSSSYELLFKSKMAMGRLQPPRYRFHVRNSCEVSRYAILLPSGEKLVRSARGTCSIFGVPPCGETRKSLVYRPGGALKRSERKRMFLPSGVQPRTMSFDGWKVSRFGSPPSADMTYTSGLPSYSPVKAIHFPSGENFGNTSSPTWEVRRRAVPPSREEIHRSPAYAKTTLSLEMLAYRKSLVGPSGAASAAAAFAGIAARQATAARLSHNQTFNRMGMGFIRNTPESKFYPGSLASWYGRLNRGFVSPRIGTSFGSKKFRAASDLARMHRQELGRRIIRILQP